jgi:hypothetical protein
MKKVSACYACYACLFAFGVMKKVGALALHPKGNEVTTFFITPKAKRGYACFACLFAFGVMKKVGVTSLPFGCKARAHRDYEIGATSLSLLRFLKEGTGM